jgi:hypothetical protein
MASESNTVHEADERTALLRAAAFREARRSINDSPIAQIRTKTSNLPEEQRDKLLFEVFDMLLTRNKLSPAPIVLAKGIGKVKRKVVTAPGERAMQSKPCPSKPQS